MLGVLPICEKVLTACKTIITTYNIQLTVHTNKAFQQKTSLYICSINEKQKDMKAIIEYTNARLTAWYSNVKREYGVIGKGVCTYNESTNELVVNYTEDGVDCVYKEIVYPDFKINTFFDIWSSEANVENDRIN